MTSRGIPQVTWPTLGPERDALWSDVEVSLGYRFRDPTLRDDAMMSAAWANEAVAKGWGDYASNRHMAWLGDALINLYATIRILGEDFYTPTGSGTPKRQQLVSNLALARAGLRIGLGPMLLLTSGEQDNDWKAGGWVVVTATAVEALLGAVWIDVEQVDDGEDPREVTEAVYDAIVPPESATNDPGQPART